MTGLIKGLQPYSPAWKNHGTGGGTSFTLDVSSTTNATILIVGGVIQLAGTDYTVSGTTVTTTTSVTSGVEVISAVLYNLGSVTTPAAGSVNFDALSFTSQAQGDILYRGSSSWARLPAGTSGQFLKTEGTGANPTWGTVSAGFTLATEQATTSGTSKTFGSIPAGTKMIVVMFEGVSYTADVQTLLTIGDAGGLETSGYAATAKDVDVASETHSTSAFIYDDGEGAAGIITGAWTLTLKDASNYTWVATGVFRTVDSMTIISGVKSLSAELTQLQISGGTFDAGSINVMYM
jgi:hypothetical protein